MSFVDTVIYHDFGDLSIFHPFFGLESQIMTLSQKFQKSDSLGLCSFKIFFHDVEKLRRIPKIFVKVIQRFWYVQHVGLIVKKNPPDAAKDATCFPHQDFEIQFFLNFV